MVKVRTRLVGRIGSEVRVGASFQKMPVPVGKTAQFELPQKPMKLDKTD